MPKATLSDGQYCHSPLSLITSLMQAMVARMMVVVMMTVVVNVICGKTEQKPYSHSSADDKSYTLFPFLWYLQNRWHWQDESLDVNRTATSNSDRTLNQFPDIWRNSAPCNLCEKRRDETGQCQRNGKHVHILRLGGKSPKICGVWTPMKKIENEQVVGV